MGGGDSGHSALASRRIYLRKTVESLKPTFPHYTVCVATKPDYDYVTDEKNELGFYDVLHYYTLPKPSRLGFATVHTAQQAMLNNPKWSRFDYVFYTESDQILHVRDVHRLLHIASSEVPNHVLPHRISPVPRRVDMGPEPFDWGNGRVLGVAAGTKAMQEFGRNAPKKSASHHRCNKGVVLLRSLAMCETSVALEARGAFRRGTVSNRGSYVWKGGDGPRLLRARRRRGEFPAAAV